MAAGINWVGRIILGLAQKEEEVVAMAVEESRGMMGRLWSIGGVRARGIGVPIRG